MRNKGQYLFITGKLTNDIHNVTLDQLLPLQRELYQETKENIKVTESTYNGENYYGQFQYPFSLEREYLYRDQKTSGSLIQYPHGVVINQPAYRHYYRGENQRYKSSQPTLLRSLEKYKTNDEKELYRLVADMRISEFLILLNKMMWVS